MTKNTIAAAGIASLVLLIALAIPASPSGAGSAVPKQSELKARVNQFYRAYVDGNWKGVHDLLAPDDRRCHTAAEIEKGWKQDSDVKVISWRIRNIEAMPAYAGLKRTIECTSETFSIDAGARV